MIPEVKMSLYFITQSTFFQYISQPFTEVVSALPQHSTPRCFQSLTTYWISLYYFRIWLRLVSPNAYLGSDTEQLFITCLSIKLKSTSLFNLILYWSYFSCLAALLILFPFQILLYLSQDVVLKLYRVFQ